jgi:hypothetical protein
MCLPPYETESLCTVHTRCPLIISLMTEGPAADHSVIIWAATQATKLKHVITQHLEYHFHEPSLMFITDNILSLMTELNNA